MVSGLFKCLTEFISFISRLGLKCHCDQKNHFYFFFGFRNFVYETLPMRNFSPNFEKKTVY